jgi:hypothetical protein
MTAQSHDSAASAASTVEAAAQRAHGGAVPRRQQPDALFKKAGHLPPNWSLG